MQPSTKKQKFCHIPKQEFTEEINEDENYYKIRCHFHYTGKCCGVAHSICNLR